MCIVNNFFTRNCVEGSSVIYSLNWALQINKSKRIVLIDKIKLYVCILVIHILRLHIICK